MSGLIQGGLGLLPFVVLGGAVLGVFVIVLVRAQDRKTRAQNQKALREREQFWD